MLGLRYPPSFLQMGSELCSVAKKFNGLVVCSARGPRPRYPRVWKSRKKIGTISKAQKLVDCIKGLSNLKEEVYGALDSFIAWELDFPLIVVKKALKTLEYQKEWKRIIQVIKWMLSKGQGKTMGTYYALINALAEDGRLEEAEEFFNKILSENLESLPRIFFTKMISIYRKERMHDNMIEVFADMEELGVRPEMKVIDMIGEVFQERGMMDKYEKLKKKYPPPKWEYRYIKGKRLRIRVNQLQEQSAKASPDSDLDNAAEVVASAEDNGNHVAEFASPDTELDNATEVITGTEDIGNHAAEFASPDNSKLDGAAEVISGTEYNGNCDAEFAAEDDNELVESVTDDS